MTHGRTLASWSRRVQTISSPGSSVRPTAPAKAIVSAVMLKPKTIWSGGAPSRAPALARADSTSSSVACAAAKTPPWLAPRPERIQASIASIAVSTICVPAGPSSRAQLEAARPGKRSRFIRCARRLADELGVVAVGDGGRRVGGRQPADLVDLVVGLELRVLLRLHQPVADDLGAALAVLVGGRLELGAEPALQPDLLLDLAQRRVLPALALVELALGQRPVVVARAVDDHDLDAVVAAPPHHAAGRLDLRRFGIDRHRRSS